MAHSKCALNLKDTGSLNCAHRSPMVSTPWINWKCLLFRLLPSITPLGMRPLHETVVQTSLTQLSPQPITQLPLLHPDKNTFYSNHCHNGQGQPPVGHRAKCLMSGGRGLPKPRHTHATTPVSRKHQFSSAKLHVSMFWDDIASCHDVPMTLTGVFTTLLDIPIATPAGEIQFWVSVPQACQELQAVARPPVWNLCTSLWPSSPHLFQIVLQLILLIYACLFLKTLVYCLSRNVLTGRNIDFLKTIQF